MSGHSHWAKIRRSKASNDAKRGRVWSKLAKRIIVAAKTGGANPDENLQLRYAIDEAKAANMPNDTIDKAIKKGSSRLAAENYEHVVYEGYGPAGVAFMVDCLTDNRNRTGPEMRKLFERGGGQLGSANCVSWMFQQKGSFVISSQKADEETLMEVALQAGADDVKAEGDLFEITCQVGAFSAVKDELARSGIEAEAAEIAMVPMNTVTVAGDKARQVLNLMEAFEEHDDVQKAYSNFDIPEEMMAEAERNA